MKKTKLFTILSFFFLNSCIYYKSVNITEISKESLTTLAKYKPLITVAGNSGDKPMNLISYTITDSVLSGKLLNSTETYRYTGQDVFRRNKLPNASSNIRLNTPQNLAEGDIEIPIKNITRGQVYEKAIAPTVLATTVAAAGVSSVGLFVFLLIACNCPHVAILNMDGTENFQGSLFPGSMFKMLERTDNLILSKHQKASNGLIEIKVYNELEEVQYIDNVELLGVSHTFDFLGLNQEKKLIAFNQGELPIAAKAQNGVDVLAAISKRDEVDYNFDEVGIDSELNSVELTFNTKNLAPKAQLVIRGQQSKWLEQTAEFFFQQFGTYFPKWVNEMNDGDANKYNQNAINQGISMNAYAKKNGKWEYLGSYDNVGTAAKRDITLPIELSKYGEQIEIKLECAHAFWNIDQISLTSEWNTNLQTTSFSIASAVNEKGEIVKETISKTDNEYVTQAKKGTFTTINFEVPDAFEGTLVLNASGYYNHVRAYKEKPNRKYLKEMQKTALSTHQLSRTLSMYSELQLATAD